MVVDTGDRPISSERARSINEIPVDGIIESITDGFFALDPQWRLSYVNSQAERICDMQRRDMLGRTLWELFPALQGTNLEREYRRAMRERVSFELENFWEPWQRWFLVRCSPAADGGLSLFFQDISQRKASEEQVRLGAELLTFLIDRSPTGFYIVDADFRISHINADSQARAFRNVNPAVGRRLDDAMRVLWPEPLATEIINIFRHTLETGEPYKSPGLVSPRADLESVETYEWQLQRILMPDRRWAVVCYFYDTTLLREAEQEVRRALEKVEQASRMKDEFLATLSHELRTPMSAILGWSQVLVRGASADDIKEGVEIIERNARLQAQIIEDLLDMNRIISGKLRLEIQSMQIDKVVEAAIKSITPAAEAKGIDLELTCDPRLGSMYGDANRLQQVISNLLSNAIKFTPAPGKVRIACRLVGSEMQITVTDSGKGIAPEFLPHLFERFRQQDATTTRHFGGLGLGLSIVKHITELHGGTVQAASDGEGQGATFTVNLPLSLTFQPQLSSGALVGGFSFSPRDMRKAGDLDAIDTSALAGRTILVIDDERDARELISKVLGDRGANCVQAASGEEAIAFFEAGFPSADGRPHLIISDLGMPGVDGYDVMARVRSLPPDKGGAVPAIALTAFARAEDRARSLRAGFQVHLAKPVELRELLLSIISLIG